MPPSATALLNAVVTLAAAPGIYSHEYGHYLACRLSGLDVESRPTVFPLTEDALLEHEPAGDFGTDLLVAIAPFLLNSILALAAFALLGASPPPIAWLFGWLGMTFGVTAIPSDVDTGTLLPGAETVPWPGRAIAYAVAGPIRAATVSVVVAGPIAFLWTGVLYSVAILL